jgi:hypothetical protein
VEQELQEFGEVEQRDLQNKTQEHPYSKEERRKGMAKQIVDNQAYSCEEEIVQENSHTSAFVVVAVGGWLQQA